jgi:hypothetical protein
MESIYILVTLVTKKLPKEKKMGLPQRLPKKKNGKILKFKPKIKKITEVTKGKKKVQSSSSVRASKQKKLKFDLT